MTNCQRAINIHPLPLALAKHSIYKPALHAESKTRAMIVPICHQSDTCPEGEQGQQHSPGSNPELKPWRSPWKGNSEIRAAQNHPSDGLDEWGLGFPLETWRMEVCASNRVQLNPKILSAVDPAQEKPPRSVPELQGTDSPALPKPRTGGRPQQMLCFSHQSRRGKRSCRGLWGGYRQGSGGVLGKAFSSWSHACIELISTSPCVHSCCHQLWSQVCHQHKTQL